MSGTDVRMAEHGASTMNEVQGFYAPTYRYSIGGGHLSLQSDLNDCTRDFTYVRVNYLPKRWNFFGVSCSPSFWDVQAEAR